MENLKAFFTRRPERLLGRCGMLFLMALKSASNLNGNLNCSKELEHYAS